MRAYRGTQRPGAKGVRGAHSYTTSLPVALIYSAMPPDIWAGRTKSRFLPTSTVIAVDLSFKKPLIIDSISETMGGILEKLRYGTKRGPSIQEALGIYGYLHRRLIGTAQGGDFSYRALDEEGEEKDESDVPISLLAPISLISEAYDEFEYEPSLDVAHRLEADTFIFIDSSIVQKVARRLGYDGIIYQDVFSGGTYAAPELLSTDVENLPGVSSDVDLEIELVPTIEAYRPLRKETVRFEWSRPALALRNLVLS